MMFVLQGAAMGMSTPKIFKNISQILIPICLIVPLILMWKVSQYTATFVELKGDELKQLTPFEQEVHD